MRISFVLLFIVFALSAAFASGDSAEVRGLRAAAEGYRMHGDLDSAVTVLKRAVSLDPGDASSRGLLGEILLEKGDFHAAEREFSEAVSIDPGLCSAFVGRGRAFLALGDERRALADFSSVISRFPDYSEAYNARGELYYKAGLYSGALGDFTMAIARAPANYSALVNRARTLVALSKFDEALADLNAVTAAYEGVPLGTPGIGDAIAWAFFYKGHVYEMTSASDPSRAALAVAAYESFLKCKIPAGAEDKVSYAEAFVSRDGGDAPRRVECSVAKVSRQGSGAVRVELRVSNGTGVPVSRITVDNFDLSLDGEAVGRRRAVFAAGDGGSVPPFSEGSLFMIVDGVKRPFSTWSVPVFEFEVNRL